MPQKIVFMGTPNFSVPSLDILFKSGYEIVSVYTQSAKKSKRGQKYHPSPVEKFALEKSLNVRSPEILDTREEFNFLKKSNIDLAIVVAYGKLIPKKFLSLPKYGFINIHASLLPKWRGAAPIQRSILNLDKKTGISIMKLEEKLDCGPVLLQKEIEIKDDINSKILSERLSFLGAESLIETIELFKNNKVKFFEQDHLKASYAKKITKSESQINWEDKAKNILAKINALNPNPGAWFKYKNERYKVWKAKISSGSGSQGFTIDNNLTVGCRDKSVSILEIQKQGKSKQTIDQFLLGNKIPIGEQIV